MVKERIDIWSKKLIKILAIILAVELVVCGIYYAYCYKLWVFSDADDAVGLPVEQALLGAAPSSTPAWKYTSCHVLLRDKIEQGGENRDFALNYYRLHDVQFDMDISNEVTEGQLPLFIQWDKRWGYQLYGTNFMGNNGCGPTALSMVYVGLTGDTTMHPYAMAKFAEEREYYMPRVGTKWALMDEGAKELGLTVEVFEKKDTADAEAVKAALMDGKPVICPMAPGDFTRGGHFIVLTGIDENNQVSVLDPNSYERTATLWDFDRVMEQTRYAWGYSYTPAE